MSNKKPKECFYCVNQLDVDYKDVRTLRRFINFYMKILPGDRTGVCAWHQRKLTQAVKRARVMSLLAPTHK
ncbi:30S ribosomal protein S18 [Patescibacteria group bacterium]|nr:30S ribosomal protein S18 [Patescibacteria group bacterium]